MSFTASPLANIVADDPRADGGQRRITLCADTIGIDRSLSGIRMRLALPVRCYRGVTLSVIEGAQGPFYRVALDHADPDLRVTLAESLNPEALVPEWRGWAKFFRLPRLAQGADTSWVALDGRLGELVLGAAQPRKRGWPLKFRRSRMSASRKSAKSRPHVVHRDEREIICYE
ncbi:hypothetical protein CCR94_12005 [Rhodoblastus sphagnicola]|uniref:Uncharacterized protein n=1 Tax=Rhodoblastus sphagnicola TaxID=333368 RepID=A0A2S6N7M3_9HYPH|nr:DUF6101 family protein [Rhodoblastus sphagnicola]MBB4196719.1 hypothetical protein [Rhodoblastus sphagnicola]PPQ30608.1 hypothetical protein CCR94_12005 [Rhodoblastus sphagnicola]